MIGTENCGLLRYGTVSEADSHGSIFGFEVMVLIGALATVFGMFANARVPRLVTTVGYDPRFSYGDYGILVETTPDRLRGVEQLLRQYGAVEVRNER